jgi:hypothetical protein
LKCEAIELRTFPKVAKAKVVLIRGKQEYVAASWVELSMGDDLLDVLWGNFRPKVYDVKSYYVVLKVPDVDAVIIRGKKVLAVGTRAHAVDALVVAVLEVLALNALLNLVHYCILWENDLSVYHFRLLYLFVLLALQPPQLDDFFVRGQQLDATITVVQEFYCVDFFVELDAFEVIKLRLV